MPLLYTDHIPHHEIIRMRVPIVEAAALEAAAAQREAAVERIEREQAQLAAAVDAAEARLSAGRQARGGRMAVPGGRMAG